jgi:hypothetical protein
MTGILPVFFFRAHATPNGCGSARLGQGSTAGFPAYLNWDNRLESLSYSRLFAETANLPFHQNAELKLICSCFERSFPFVPNQKKHLNICQLRGLVPEWQLIARKFHFFKVGYIIL